MIKKINFAYLSVVILFGSLCLAILRPALMELAGRPEEGYSLKIDYGIPTQWFRQEKVDVPPECPLPKNSVGLDFICIERSVRDDGMNSSAYDPRYRGDPFNRPLRYPPLHLLAFCWIPLLGSARAIGLWGVLTFVLTFANILFWFEWTRRLFPGKGPANGPLAGVLFSALFAVSYPVIFQFERGQTDSIVLTLVSLCGYCLWRRRWFWAGALASFAALFKIYPVFFLVPLFAAGILTLVLGIKEKNTKEKKAGTMLLLGQIAAAAASVLFMFPQHWHYLTKVLLPYARADEMPPESVFYHSMHAAFGGWGLWFWIAVWAVLSAAFLFLIGRFRGLAALAAGSPKTLLFFFTLFAAWSVFMAKTSYDYNLILLIPFFAVLIYGGLGDAYGLMKAGGCLTLLGFALPRWLQDVLLPDLYPVSAYLILQVVGIGLLTVSAVFFLFKKDKTAPGI